MPERIISIIEPIGNSNGSNWNPVVGSETTNFLDTVVPECSREETRDAAVSIIKKCIPPSGHAGVETGLVVGYVQSGKTMSFETVTTLAHDNSFHMVIIVAGTSNALLMQSTERLKDDLRICQSDRPRCWIHFQNPSPKDDSTISSMRNALEEWKDNQTPSKFNKTILITVLKHHQHLKNLTNLINKFDVDNTPVLIIDDEADQASLNTEAHSEQQDSTTYRRFVELRQSLLCHTFLQYTATPQAPLLVNLIDTLSPNFVQVLRPGSAYVGGKEFFGETSKHICIIPNGDVATQSHPLTQPPNSLLEALRIFMVGVAIGLMHGGNSGNRSMLIHPSHLTEQHVIYYNWVREIFDEWKDILNQSNDDPDKMELIEEFDDAYNQLKLTVSKDTLPEFSEIKRYFSSAFRTTVILEVNSRGGPTSPIDWHNAYGWILVGGQVLDRGFTVEGLTVTYMPRGIGGGNADTIQQRARFFGYKRSYFGFCRVYIEQETLDAYRAYVAHEEDIRSELINIQNSNKSLDHWKRDFILDTRLQPCRSSVVGLDSIRAEFSNDWFRPTVVHDPDGIISQNRITVENFVKKFNFQEDEGSHKRTDAQRHQVCKRVSLITVAEHLLVKFRVTGSSSDSRKYTALLLLVSKLLDKNSDIYCTIYKMSPKTGRKREVDEHGVISNLFQGEAPVEPRSLRGTVYPGDRNIRDNDNISLQIHNVTLTQNNHIVVENVKILAIWIPKHLSLPLFVHVE